MLPLTNKDARWRLRLSIVIVAFVIIATLVPSMALLSNSNSFRITAPTASSTIGTKVSFVWTSVSSASSYRLQLSSTDDPQFEGPDYSLKVSGSTGLVKSNVEPMTYIARVTAYDTNGKKLARTATISFVVKKGAPNNIPGSGPVITDPTTPPTATHGTTPPTQATVPPTHGTVPSTQATNPPVTNPPTPGKFWTPKPGTTWYWQLSGKDNESVNVQMYDIDLFDAVPSARSYTVAGFGTVNLDKGDNAGIIDRLHARGITAICYIDTGAVENNRPDTALFPKASYGTVAQAGDGSNWDEEWLDTSSPAAIAKWAPIQWARFDLAKSIGCDGVEADQNNHVGNETGFKESPALDVAWYDQVATQGHARGLSMGMKNGIEAIQANPTLMVKDFDWALNEECHGWGECDVLQPFLSANKAVFNAEYEHDGQASETQAGTCDNKPSGISSMLYPLDLDGGYFYDCLTKTTVTPKSK